MDKRELQGITRLANSVAKKEVMRRRSFQTGKVDEVRTGGGANVRMRDSDTTINRAGIALQGKVRPEDEVVMFTPDGNTAHAQIIGLSPYITGAKVETQHDP